MIEFHLADFLQPLSPLVLLASFIIGAGMGLSVRQLGHGAISGHGFWLLATGLVFFIPLSILRALEGSTVWERLAATYVLWAIFVVGYELGIRSRWPR